MTGFRTRASLAAGLMTTAILCAGPAVAQAAGEARTAVLQRLLDCRKAADAERLACYDAAASALDAAEAKGDIVVMDREQTRAARRQAFGFNLPSLSVFERGEAPEAVDRVAATVKTAYQQGDGKWVVELDGGAVWAQTDNEPVLRTPRAGSKAEIRKAAMGSFFLNLDGQRAVRARRVK